MNPIRISNAIFLAPGVKVEIAALGFAGKPRPQVSLLREMFQ